MKNKLMAVSVLLLLALMAVPVMAKPIGPQKAVKNPNITITPEAAEILLPSGGFVEWMANTESGALDFVHALDASKVKIPNAMPLDISDLMGLMLNPEAALEFENKWGYISYDVLVALFMFQGASEQEAKAFASMWPDGIYARFVNVGKSWDS